MVAVIYIVNSIQVPYLFSKNHKIEPYRKLPRKGVYGIGNKRTRTKRKFGTYIQSMRIK